MAVYENAEQVHSLCLRVTMFGAGLPPSLSSGLIKRGLWGVQRPRAGKQGQGTALRAWHSSEDVAQQLVKQFEQSQL